MQTIPAALLGICKETCQNTKETHQHTQRTNQHTRNKHQDTKVPAALFGIFHDFDLGHTRDVSTRKKDLSPHKREQSTNLRRFLASFTTPNSDPSCVAVFCNVLQGVAGYCVVLQRFAVYTCGALGHVSRLRTRIHLHLSRAWASYSKLCLRKPTCSPSPGTRVCA